MAVAQPLAIANDLGPSVEQHARMIRAAADHGARLVIFPELSLTGYDRGLGADDAISVDDAPIAELVEVVASCGAAAVVGAPVRAGDGLAIASHCIGVSGEVATYTKQVLHPGEEIAFRPGRGGAPLALDRDVVGLAICAEVSDRAHVQAAAAAGASLYAASCFFTPAGVAGHAADLAGYAGELGLGVLMANYGGPSGGFDSGGRSAIWSDTGQCLATAPQAGPGLLVAERRDSVWSGRRIA